MTDLLEQRLTEAGRRWQAAQPSPPAVPVDRLAAAGTRRTRTAWVAAAAAVAVTGGIAFAVTRPATPAAPLGPPPPAPSTHQVGPVVPGAVPFVPLPARHPDRRTVAAFGSVSVYGAISGRVRPGDTLSFTIRLVSTHDLPLDHCPDVTVSVGEASHTWQLNCAQVPSVDDQGRPYLPADRLVPFQMQVRVPDLPGRQKVLWVIDGPQATPGTYGIIHIG
jgi:hypothetical protein